MADLSDARTEEEKERAAHVQAQLDQINAEINEEFGPGTVTAAVAFADDQEMIDHIAATDAATFVAADGFGWYRGGSLPVLPAIEVSGLDYLERACREGILECGPFGIGNQLEDADVPLFARFALSIRGKDCPLFIWIDKAPAAWVEQAMHRFLVLWPEGPDGRRAWFATGPMRQHPEGFRMPGKIGRNDPCPCNSGLKLKKCHGK